MNKPGEERQRERGKHEKEERSTSFSLSAPLMKRPKGEFNSHSFGITEYPLSFYLAAQLVTVLYPKSQKSLLFPTNRI